MPEKDLRLLLCTRYKPRTVELRFELFVRICNNSVGGVRGAGLRREPTGLQDTAGRRKTFNFTTTLLRGLIYCAPAFSVNHARKTNVSSRLFKMDVAPLGSPLTVPLESMTASVGDLFDGLAPSQTTTSATHLHLPVLDILTSEPGPPRVRVYSTDAQNFSHDMTLAMHTPAPCRSRAKSVEAVPNFSTIIPGGTSDVGITKPIAISPGVEKELRVGINVIERGHLRSQSHSSNPQHGTMTIMNGSKETNKIEREFCGDITKSNPPRIETQSTLGATIETSTSNEDDPIIHLRRPSSFDDLSAVSSLSDTHSYQNLDSKSGRRLGSLFNRKKRHGKGMSFGTAIKGPRRDVAPNESLSRETMDRSLEQHLLCRSARSLNHPDVDSNKEHRRIKSGVDEKSTGVKSSWLMPISSASQGDMIDMNTTDPVDPFSGLIGMPQGDVSAASESSSSCLNVFGSPVSKSSLGGVSPLEPPCIDQACKSSLLSNRPSVISSHCRRRTCGASVTSDFDPLYEDEEYTSSSIVGGQSFGSSTAHSALHSGLPPRRHKDDPLLSKSRYRSPLLFASPNNNGRVSSRKSKNGHRGGHHRVATVDNCMFGSIAQVELSSSHKHTPYPTTPGSIGDLIDCQSAQHRSVDETATVSITPVECTASLNTSPVEEEGEDVGSVESFEEELRKGDGKAKVITKEVKNVFQPLAVSARKLLRIPKQEASTLRADGCLT